MDIKIKTVDEFIEYYDKGYREGKEDIKYSYGISDKTFYRKINHRDHNITKVKISKELREKVREAFIADDRLTNGHMYSLESKVLFNDLEVYNHLIDIGEFELYINYVKHGRNRKYIPLHNIDEITNKDVMIANYEAIKFYLLQASTTSMLNMLGLSNYKNMHSEKERAEHKRFLNQTPHLRFVVCGITKYVLLQHTKFASDDKQDEFYNFMESFNSHEMKLDTLFYKPVLLDF